MTDRLGGPDRTRLDPTGPHDTYRPGADQRGGDQRLDQADKLINDGFGHVAGDGVLRRTVAAIRETLRADEGIYRFGGEEFLVLVQTPDDTTLARVAERLRQTVADLRITHPENVPHGIATISLGAVLLTADDLGQTDDEWFARADAALYAAKEAGRNRVVLAAR